MLIGIRFSDNDFYNTLVPFMELFRKWDHRAQPVTKEQVVEMFNFCALGLYRMCQNSYRYGVSEEDTARMKEYLRISIKNVFFDDEVKKHYLDCDGWDNGEFHYYDTATKAVITI